MITKDRLRAVLKLAVPMTVGLASSFIMVFADLAMIGRLGTDALAAIGFSGFSYTFILAFVIGVTPVIQGMVARRVGENSSEPKCLPLNAALLLVLLIGVPLSILCYFLTPTYFSILSSDPAVLKEGIPYLSTLFISVIAVGISAAFEGYWGGVGKTKIFMVNIIFVNLLNIFLNYMLIFGNLGAPALGSLGAGIATAISMFARALILFLVTLWKCRGEGFLTIKPSSALVMRIYTIGLPENIREALFSLGYIVFYWMVGLIGTVELATMNVLIRVALVLAVFPIALGIASSTLVSKAIGRGDIPDAVQWGWDIAKIGIIWSTLLGLPLFLFPNWFLSLFITDPEAISMAVIPLQMTGVSTGITSLIFIFAYTLVSIGDSARVLMVSIGTQWFIFLPAVWIIGPYLNYGLLEIWGTQTAYALIASLLMTALWHDGRWKIIKI